MVVAHIFIRSFIFLDTSERALKWHQSQITPITLKVISNESQMKLSTL